MVTPEHGGGDFLVWAESGKRHVESAPPLRLSLLGGFRVEPVGVAHPGYYWQRRTAKTLIKLLATCPGHALHREQVVEALWPGADLDSALNSLGKALHAARRGLEPELLPRQRSAYLLLSDSMLALDSERVAVDADHFENLAEEALRRGEIEAYEGALAAYGGELLPEDRYADWCAERRGFLAELRVRLLLGLAAAFEAQGAHNESADRLRAVLQQDPTREEVHRRLMRLYADMGTPDQAVRQFHACEDVLRRELDLAPQGETVSLFRDVLGNRIPERISSGDPVDSSPPPPPRPPRRTGTARIAASTPRTPTAATPAPTASAGTTGVAAAPAPAPAAPAPAGTAANAGRDTTGRFESLPAEPAADSPFVGREQLLDDLWEWLARRDGGPGMVVLSGEAGVGKTRLLGELATRARAGGAVVLWGGSGAHAPDFSYGPFAVALEEYAASLPAAERSELVHRHPTLARFVPSLGLSGEPAWSAAGSREDHLAVIPAIVRLLTDLAEEQPMLLVLGDLHEADPFSLNLLRYLAHLSVRRRWLMVGAVREEEVETRTDLWRLIEATMRERLCLKVELQCLSREESESLVEGMLGGGRVGDDRLEQIYLRSRGNPLFVSEIVREVRERHQPGFGGGEEPPGGWDRPGSPWDVPRVPPRVRAMAAMRLASMDPPVRRVLQLAAAASATEISLDELRTGARALRPPVSEPVLFDALDQALQMRVLEERAGGYAFRHPLVRCALYEGLSRHRREQLQAALGRPRSGTQGPLAAVQA